MQGTRVQALVREDPTCRGANKNMRHNYWACALEPACHSYWACTPRARAPQQEKPPQWEAGAPRQRVAPAHCNRRKPTQQQRPNAAKINKLIKTKNVKFLSHYDKTYNTNFSLFFLLLFVFLGCTAACGILVPQPGRVVLTTGPPGNSPFPFFCAKIIS